jgi:nucleotide-binding universal stress UspA family protein
MARVSENGPVTVTVLHVVPVDARNSDCVRAEQVLDYTLEGVAYEHVQKAIVEGSNVVETVLEKAKECDLIVVGATAEPLFRNLLIGDVPVQIARRAEVTVVMVKRRSSRLHSFLRQTVLEPTTQSKGETTESKVEAGGRLETDL